MLRILEHAASQRHDLHFVFDTPLAMGVGPERPAVEHSPLPRRVSRVLHFVGDLTSRASASVVVTLALSIYVVVLAANGFPESWQVGFSTAAESVALVMLFVIQHTQSRQQAVIQLKLDELIRSSPNADDLLVHLEQAEDAELIEREHDQVAHHESLRDSDSVSVSVSE